MKNIPVFILLWAGLILPASAMAEGFHRLVDIYSCAENKASYHGAAGCATFGPKDSRWEGHATRFPLFFLTAAACREWASEYINLYIARRSHNDGSEWFVRTLEPNCVPHSPVYAPKEPMCLPGSWRAETLGRISVRITTGVMSGPLPGVSFCFCVPEVGRGAREMERRSLQQANRQVGDRTVVKARCVLIP